MGQPTGSGGNGGVPSGEVPLLGADQNTAMEAGLTKTGVLCCLCGRTTGEEDCDPREYLRVDPKLGADQQKPQVVITRIVACRREDCDDSELAPTAHAWRPYVGWKVTERETVAVPGEESESGKQT